LDIIAGISAICRDFCVLGAINGFDLPAMNGVNSTAKSVIILGPALIQSQIRTV